MLLWMEQVSAAKVQLRKAVADAPTSVIGREAQQFLARLENVGTK
jgi:hypothetical protein